MENMYEELAELLEVDEVRIMKSCRSSSVGIL